jgi:hypothetical protein
MGASFITAVTRFVMNDDPDPACTHCGALPRTILLTKCVKIVSRVLLIFFLDDDF